MARSDRGGRGAARYERRGGPLQRGEAPGVGGGNIRERYAMWAQPRAGACDEHGDQRPRRITTPYVQGGPRAELRGTSSVACGPTGLRGGSRKRDGPLCEVRTRRYGGLSAGRFRGGYTTSVARPAAEWSSLRAFVVGRLPE